MARERDEMRIDVQRVEERWVYERVKKYVMLAHCYLETREQNPECVRSGNITWAKLNKPVLRGYHLG